MNLKKLVPRKNTYLIAYKLLHDALLLALISFIAMIIGEGLIPGFISQRISFSKVVIVIIIILGFISWIGSKFQITYDAPKIKKNKLVPVLILGAFLLIGNSMLHFDLWTNIIITLIVLVIFFLIYELIFSD
ncbi:MAG: hypothetical protein ACD_56C00071G0001 [uncultured bacterium]|nr:MAG: hypothetical protein ACD_56C00071G0001 [uncultured bacterium]KKQ60570.1 MAG: hypothetical protein US82_C0032G0008 [Parcubacteria group bacterium GW2011_GWC1_38_22]